MRKRPVVSLHGINILEQDHVKSLVFPVNSFILSHVVFIFSTPCWCWIRPIVDKVKRSSYSLFICYDPTNQINTQGNMRAGKFWIKNKISKKKKILNSVPLVRLREKFWCNYSALELDIRYLKCHAHIFHNPLGFQIFIGPLAEIFGNCRSLGTLPIEQDTQRSLTCLWRGHSRSTNPMNQSHLKQTDINTDRGLPGSNLNGTE